jgi:ABC-2 type transport system permease protein
MTTTPALVATFLWRGWRVERSYRFAFVSRIAFPVLVVVTMLFMDRLVGPAAPLAPYGGGYLPFALLGLLVADLQSAATGSVVAALRNEQLTGTLDALLAATPAPVARVVLACTAYEGAWALAQAAALAIALAAWAAARGLPLHPAATLLAGACLLVYCIGLWLLSAAAALVFKRANPIAAMLATATYVAGGVLYPVAVLPGWMQRLAWLLPSAQLTEALRRATLAGAGPRAIASPLAASAAFAAAALLLGAWALRTAVDRGRRGGWIADY